MNLEHAPVTSTPTQFDDPSQTAVHALVIEHLWLAETLARRYAGRGLDRDDLAQVARLALVKAARRFDRALGDSFPAYATFCISGEIKRYFRDSGWMVRPPRRLQELSARQRQVDSDLSLQLGRRPTPLELSSALGISPQELQRAQATNGCFHGTSLDAPAIQDSAVGGRLDLEDDATVAVEERDWLARALSGLSERELRVIRLRFVHDMTQSQIGSDIGISQIQVSRILRATLERLRTTMTASMAPT